MRSATIIARKRQMPGLRYMARGLELIVSPGMKRYVITPLLINIVIFSGLIAGTAFLFDEWMSSLMGSLPDWLHFLYWIVWVLFLLIILGFLLFCFTIVANVIAAPFNALLSVKVEDRARGSTAWREGDESAALIVARSISREFAKLRYYLPRVLGLALLSWIPGLNVFAPALWLLFGAWMMAVEYTDYSADNNGVSFRALKDALGRTRLNALGFGLVVYAMMLIPVANLFVMPAAVAGGTLFWVEKLSKGSG